MGSRHSRSISSKPASGAPGLNEAIAFHRDGKLDKAQRIYAKILKSDPQHVDALHFMGVLRHQRGDTRKAVSLIRQAIRLAPDYVDAQNNLGNVLKESGKLAEAEKVYRRLVEQATDHADAWSNLGIVLRGQGEFAQAEQAYRRAIQANAGHAAAWQNLGNLLARLDRLDEAVSAYLRVLELVPYDPTAFDALGKALYRAGRAEEAVKVYTEWLQRDPDSSIARHMLAACTGEAIPERAADDYVRKLFDSFAGSFDQVLDRLDYRAPSLISELLDRSMPEPDRKLLIADLGCGTGLCGAFLRKRAKRLLGVDLSPAMLARARARQEYDQLVEYDLDSWLAKKQQAFDLLISADTFCYFGDLNSVVQNAAGALKSSGRLVFTVELASDEAAGYRLGSSGRYQHAEGYIKDCLVNSGLETEILEYVALRREAGAEVAGLLVCATKP